MPLAPFSYSEVEHGLAESLRKFALDIRGRHAGIANEMVQIGKALSAAKEGADHGTFLSWLISEVGMQPRVAQMYMRAAEWAEAAPNAKLISHLQPTAVLKLSAKSTPPVIVEAVAEKVAAGETVSISTIDTLLSGARDERRKAKAEARRKPRQGERRPQKRLRLAETQNEKPRTTVAVASKNRKRPAVMALQRRLRTFWKPS